MDEEYDVIVCGTGLTECMLSGLMSVEGKKVLHVDRNQYYGGEAASLNLTNLYAKFRPGEQPPASFGSNRDWNCDLIPKFIMADGKLVKILITTKVTRYLEWRSVAGTYVYQYQAAGLMTAAKYLHKVPATDMEGLKSSLMGLLEKKRFINFFQFVNSYDPKDQKTWQGVNMHQASMTQVYEKFGLCRDTIDFLGHAVALYTDDNYLAKPAGLTMDKMALYISSIARYGQSPFIYPRYGLGGLPEGFSRLAAIHGGVYMLNKPVDKFVYGDDGKVCGIQCTDTETGKVEVAKAPIVICDPSYVDSPETKKIRKTGKIVRAICVLNHPIASTNDSDSCQIIIPQSQLKRRSDVFILMVSNSHATVPEGKYLAIVSTVCETSTPELELKAAFDLLGNIEAKFVTLSDICEPLDDGAADNVHVSKSYDASSHFESVAEDVLDIYKRILGKELDMSIPADLPQDED